MIRTAKLFYERMPQYRRNPVLFVREVLGVEPDEWQAAVLRDLGDPECRRVSVRSGQGVGKTCTEAWAVIWFLACFPFSRVVATAPTMQQLNDVLWAEVAKWISRNPLIRQILKWTKTHVYVVRYQERWFATAKTATSPENMQGFHEDNMLFIVDEASGVADPIMEAIFGTLSGPNNKLLLCGNPTQTTGSFYDSHMNPAMRKLFRCHKVSSRDVGRTDKDQIAAYDEKYGRDSNFIRVRIDGEFPMQDDDVFIPLSLLERAVMIDPLEIKQPMTVDIAVDVARFGDDQTVIGYKIDDVVAFHSKARGQDTMRTADRIVELGEHLVRKYDMPDAVVPVKIDDSGVGGGVTDRLRQIYRSDPERFAWMYPVPVFFGQRLTKNRYYADTTTFMMGTLRNLLRGEDDDGHANGTQIILPNDGDMIAQLASRKYELTPDSKLKVESKDKMKERGLASPDEGDCVCMLCAPVNRDKLRRKRRDA